MTTHRGLNAQSDLEKTYLEFLNTVVCPLKFAWSNSKRQHFLGGQGGVEASTVALSCPFLPFLLFSFFFIFFFFFTYVNLAQLTAHMAVIHAVVAEPGESSFT